MIRKKEKKAFSANKYSWEKWVKIGMIATALAGSSFAKLPDDGVRFLNEVRKMGEKFDSRLLGAKMSFNWSYLDKKDFEIFGGFPRLDRVKAQFGFSLTVHDGIFYPWGAINTPYSWGGFPLYKEVKEDRIERIGIFQAPEVPWDLGLKRYGKWYPIFKEIITKDKYTIIGGINHPEYPTYWESNFTSLEKADVPSELKEYVKWFMKEGIWEFKKNTYYRGYWIKIEDMPNTYLGLPGIFPSNRAFIITKFFVDENNNLKRIAFMGAAWYKEPEPHWTEPFAYVIDIYPPVKLEKIEKRDAVDYDGSDRLYLWLRYPYAGPNAKGVYRIDLHETAHTSPPIKYGVRLVSHGVERKENIRTEPLILPGGGATVIAFGEGLNKF